MAQAITVNQTIGSRGTGALVVTSDATGFLSTAANAPATAKANTAGETINAMYITDIVTTGSTAATSWTIKRGGTTVWVAYGNGQYKFRDKGMRLEADTTAAAANVVFTLAGGGTGYCQIKLTKSSNAEYEKFMKLITEMIENDIEFVCEEKNGKKQYVLKGIFMQGNIKNRNGRVYPMETLIKEVKRYSKEFIDKNRAYGELGHPQGPTINLERVSHMIKDLHADGNNIMGEAKVLDTPMGTIVKNLMDEGATLGVSSRGMGSLRNSKGVDTVQSDFQLATAADIVADPSAPEAFVEGIMEGVEWLQVDNRWVPQYLEQSKNTILKAKRANMQETKLKLFQDFLEKL